MSGALEQRLSADGYARMFHNAPLGLLVLAPDLTILEANDTYLQSVGMDSCIVGRYVFDVFPNSTLAGRGEQADDMHTLFRHVIDHNQPRRNEELRYDIPTRDGFEARFWSASWDPVLGADGQVDFLLHYATDITELVNARRNHREVLSRADTTSQRLGFLSEVALQLTRAETLQDIEEILVSGGSQALGTEGGSIITYAEDGSWMVTLNGSVDRVTRALYAHLPLDSPLPGCHVARTGTPLYLPDQLSGLAWDPVMADVYAHRRRDGWAFLPLMVAGSVVGAMSFCWVEAHQTTPDERDLLEGLAAQCATAVVRLQAIQTERRTAENVRQLAESLQLAMLTDPPQPADIQIEVRYRSALDIARVGGDWYDAFQAKDTSTILSIGDVAGHDAAAAGRMGQMRGLLRALAFAHGLEPVGDGIPPNCYSPAAVLTEFEHAAEALDVNHLATAILARVDPDTRTGRQSVSWSNAGNPPPMLVDRNGRVRILDPEGDLLLGVDSSTTRHDHHLQLRPGSTLLLYTDGLVERRNTSLDDGLRDLSCALAQLACQPLAELCDALLDRMAPATGEDDIALLAIRSRNTTTQHS